MTAAKLNLEIEQGATWHKPLALKAGAGASAPAMDLTGFLARMQIRPYTASGHVIAELTSTNGGLEIDHVSGALNMYISAEDTGLFSFDKAVYDLEIESSGGEVTRVLQGTITISKQVTR